MPGPELACGRPWLSHPFRQDVPEVPFIQQDQPIQTLATHAADQPLAKCVRLRYSHRIRRVPTSKTTKT
jgi:hypothetical protein